LSRSDNTPFGPSVVRPTETVDKRAYTVQTGHHSAKDSGVRALPAGEQGPTPGSEAIHTRAYAAPNWLTASGVLRKRKLIEAKGLPSFNKWRFITLTIDRQKFPEGPLSAFVAGRDNMRRFMTRARTAELWDISHKWCWKLEFQEDGWPHWHLLVGRTTKMTEHELQEVERLWGLGITNTEMVQDDDFRYSFKYAFKPVHQVEEDGLEDFDGSAPVAPQWFLDYHQMEPTKVVWTDADGITHRETVMKPVTGSKVRFWQTSRGFYETEPAEASEKKDPQSCKVPLPARVIAERVANTVQLVARDRLGKYVASGLLLLTCCASQVWAKAGWHAINGGAVFVGINSVVMPAHILKENTETKWQLHPLLKQNRLTVKQAMRLQQEPRNWQTS
jgi:hypothetical protein